MKAGWIITAPMESFGKTENEVGWTTLRIAEELNNWSNNFFIIKNPYQNINHQMINKMEQSEAQCDEHVIQEVDYYLRRCDE